MKRFAAVLTVLTLSLALATPAFAVKKGRVKYRGGTVNMEEGKEAPFKFTTTDLEVTPKKKHGEAWVVPLESITKIVYGQPAGLQLVSFSKSKKHYVTISWPKNQATIEFDKNDINRALAMLSARSGVEVEHLDEGGK